MTALKIAVTQIACDWNLAGNLDRAEAAVRAAAADGARLILLQELFETPYFCPEQKAKYFDLAKPFDGNPLIARFADLARELQVVLPISFFEQAVTSFYNSIAIADADGDVLGCYRKSHIPDGPGYQEKFYFTPGDTGFQVWDTGVGRIGVGICWDQWFPEAARAMALMGADVLLYPTANGSEPHEPDVRSEDHWRRVMQGHAGANLCALAASNRVGRESWDGAEMSFYGGSFISGAEGEILAQMDDKPGFNTAEVDLAALRLKRLEWGVFRDRRRDLYSGLC